MLHLLDVGYDFILRKFFCGLANGWCCSVKSSGKRSAGGRIREENCRRNHRLQPSLWTLKTFQLRGFEGSLGTPRSAFGQALPVRTFTVLDSVFQVNNIEVYSSPTDLPLSLR
jgi:hypothetical protein